MTPTEELLTQILAGQNEIKAELTEIKTHQQLVDERLVSLEAQSLGGVNGVGAMMYDPRLDVDPNDPAVPSEFEPVVHEGEVAGELTQEQIEARLLAARKKTRAPNKHYPGIKQYATNQNWEGEMNRVLNSSPDTGALVQSEHPSVIVIDNKEQHMEQLRAQQKSIITEF